MYFGQFCLLLLASTIHLSKTAEDGQPEVTLSNGQLQGLYLSTRGGRKIAGFLGIPYGQPPVDSFRFTSPKPTGKWTGVRNATQYGAICLQDSSGNVLINSSTYIGVIGQEDCLYLNVFTPNLSGSANLPVMVFIHGGSFSVGSGDLYTPEYLLDQDVILVTLNYRLGFLGFLSTEDEYASGNYGLKDQTLALHWVRDNIYRFGGNKNLVTIFGHGAGAASVHYHMMSPISKGLFQKGISLSGTALCPWASYPPGSHKKYAFRLAELVGCNSAHSNQLTVECMRDIPAYILTQLMKELKSFGDEPRVLFPPAIELKNISNAFLTVDPWTVSSTIPWITGITAADGAQGTAVFIQKKDGNEFLNELNDQFEGFTPSILGFRETAPDPNRISRSIRKFYFAVDEITNETMSVLTDMYTDGKYLYCSEEAVRRHSGPTYKYYFNYKSANSLYPSSLGVAHFDDLFHLFPLTTLRKGNETEKDQQFGEKYLKLFTNFAREGNPTPKGSDIIWEPVSSVANEYLYIDNDGQYMYNKLKAKRDKFWQKLEYREKPKSQFQRPPEKNDEL